jgi:16S rRNA (adenine1518-N6/adenine1519-N6)-dimethyltransferase
VTPAEIRGVLARHGLRASQSLGQNFLADERLAEKLAAAAGVSPADTVLEIGCGLGVLTRALAARARLVIGLEVDAGLVRAVRAEGLLPDSVRLLHADALEADLRGLLAGEPAPRRVVANLPYVVSSPLLRRLLDLRDLLASWSVMLQKEVAVRLLAAPGSRDYGSLGVLHRLTARVERVLDVNPRCFWPVPQVTSTFLRIEPLPVSLDAERLAEVERLARAGFAHRRKTLSNSLREALPELGGAREIEALLAAAGIEAGARAEAVPPERWLALAEAAGEADRGAA